MDSWIVTKKTVSDLKEFEEGERENRAGRGNCPSLSY